jgi:hypothetical protein
MIKYIMGYSITIQIKDKKQRNEAISLLESKFIDPLKLFKDLLNSKKVDSSKLVNGVSFCIADDFFGEDHIGLNYSSWIGEHEKFYIYNFLIFLAKKYQCTKYYYDGEEKDIKEIIKYYQDFKPINYCFFKKKDIKLVNEIVLNFIKTLN